MYYEQKHKCSLHISSLNRLTFHTLQDVAAAARVAAIAHFLLRDSIIDSDY